MRILEIVADGNPGGGTTHVLQLLSHFGVYHPIALVTQINSYLERKARELNIRTYGLDFFASRLNPQLPLHIRRIVGDFLPDVVHLHGSRSGFFFVQAKTFTPSLYTIHGYHFPKKKVVVKQLAVLAERFISKKVSHLIFVSNHDLQLANRFNLNPYKKNFSVIYCGIPIEKIPLAKPKNKVIGFIGRFVPQKDPELFLNIVQRLRDFPAIMVGGGELYNFIEDKKKRLNLSQINLTGFLTHSDTLNALTMMHILLITSRWEGLPYLSIEAMYSGVPVIAANVGGLSEIIEHGTSGFLIDSRNPDMFAQAVLSLENNPIMRAEIIAAARARVENDFSESQMLSKIRDLYEKVHEQE